LPSFKEITDCLNIASLALANMTVNTDITSNPMYDYLFSVDEVNKLVLQGMPFRDAYKTVGEQINAGNFKPEKLVNHTHEGSIGNLCLDKIQEHKQKIVDQFNFDVTQQAIEKLLKS
jgi:argininosuccinate lyase